MTNLLKRIAHVVQGFHFQFDVAVALVLQSVRARQLAKAAVVLDNLLTGPAKLFGDVCALFWRTVHSRPSASPGVQLELTAGRIGALAQTLRVSVRGAVEAVLAAEAAEATESEGTEMRSGTEEAQTAPADIAAQLAAHLGRNAQTRRGGRIALSGTDVYSAQVMSARAPAVMPRNATKP